MLTLILTSISFAVPLQVTQQGRILDSNGAGVSGLHDLTFRIYDAETSGTLLWEETITETMTNGYYAAVLGADETNNPLDSNILELYPIYLEFQLDSNSPVATRQAINSAPYAQIAGKAEVATSVNGGSVNATDVQISGNPVIDGTGSWVGPAITVDWNNIDPSTIPSYIADGDDNTQLSKTEVLNYVDGETLNLGASSQVDGSDIVTADSFSTYLPADADTLASLNCATGEIASWDGNSSWVCTSDNTLEWADIELLLNNNPVDLNASTTIGGAEILTTVDDADTLATLSCSDGEIAKYDSGLGDWYCDVDVDTTLTSTEVTTIVEAGSVNLATGSQVNGKNLIGEPSGCTDGQILVYTAGTQSWSCGEDSDTTLTATELQGVIETLTLDLQNRPSVNGSPVLTEDSTIDPTKIDGSGGTSGQVLTTDGSNINWTDVSSGDCSFVEKMSGTTSRVVISCGSNSFTLQGNIVQYSKLSKEAARVEDFHCALTNENTARCWGRDLANVISDLPSGEFIELSSGPSTICGLRTNGNIECWGSNSNNLITNAPTGIFESLESSSNNFCGINAGGGVICWGRDDTTVPVVSNTPTTTFDSIYAANAHFCGLTSSGSVECWGYDNQGQVSNTPSTLFNSISTGSYHTCGVTTSGSVECWGDNSYGESTPPSGSFLSLSAGHYTTCGIKNNNSIQCWGRDQFGVVSDAPSGEFSKVAVAEYYACGLHTNGNIDCWGQDAETNGAPIKEGSFTDIQVGQNSACGLHSFGNIICWGSIIYNQTSPP